MGSAEVEPVSEWMQSTAEAEVAKPVRSGKAAWQTSLAVSVNNFKATWSAAFSCGRLEPVLCTNSHLHLCLLAVCQQLQL